MGESGTSRTQLVLVHGATSGPWVFDDWASDAEDLRLIAPDLQQDLDVATASMDDYVTQVVRSTDSGHRTALCGWSMGGLVAMMAARRRPVDALVVIEPSLPVELHGGDQDVEVRTGTYDAAVYGEPPPGTRHRPESALARAERQRGISIPDLSCPLLVVAGDTYRHSRGAPLAEYYDGDYREFPDLNHTQLVTHPDVRREVIAWVRGHVTGMA